MNKPTPLEAGATAPDFAYRDAAGTELHTSGLRGRTYVVYFYPKDDTPGCTKQACGLRDQWTDFSDQNISVIGVSGDSEASHDKFRKKHSLNFPLASDPELTTANGFGVYGEKKFMGKTYEGIYRMTFIVGPGGTILKTYPKVKPEEHANQILSDLKELPA